MAVFGQDAITRKLKLDEEDKDKQQPSVASAGGARPNSTQAINARGKVVYGGGFSAANNQQGQQFDPGQIPAFGGQQGQFQADKMPRGFDFNADYEAGVNQLNQQRANLTSQREAILRRLAEDFEQFQTGLGQQYEDVQTQNKQNMADRGLLRSGINVAEQQEIGEEYTDQKQRGSRELARGKEDIQGQFSSGMQQLTNYMEQLERNRAAAQEEADQRRAEEEAARKAREKAEKAAKEEAERLKREEALRRQELEEMKRIARQREPAPVTVAPISGGGGGGGGGGGFSGGSVQGSPVPQPQVASETYKGPELLSLNRQLTDFFKNKPSIDFKSADGGRGNEVVIKHTGDLTQAQSMQIRSMIGSGVRVKFEKQPSSGAVSRRVKSGSGRVVA